MSSSDSPNPVSPDAKPTSMEAGVGAGAVGRPASTRKALAFVYAGYALRYLNLLILVPFYGRVLGAGEYGRVLAAMSLLQVVWMLVEFGFPAAGARDIAAASTPSSLGAVYGRHVMGRLATTVPAIVVGVAATLASPVLSERPVFGLLATANGVIAGFNLGWYFQGTLRFRTSVLIEMLGFALNLPLILLLVRGADDGWLVLLALTMSGAICTVAAHVIALRSMQRGAISWRGGGLLVKTSTALFAHRGLTMLMASSSTYIVSLSATASEVGWYGAAERLINAGLSLLQPANQVLVGTVCALIGVTEQKQAFALMRKATVVLTGCGVAMLVITALLAPLAVPFLLGTEFTPSVPMVSVMGLMFPFVAFSQVINGYVLIPLRFDGLVSRISLFGAVSNIVLMVALQSAFGGIGVAWGRSIGYAWMALVLLEVLRRKQLFGRIFA